MRKNNFISCFFICFTLIIIKLNAYSQPGDPHSQDSTINAIISHISIDSIESNMRALEEYGNRFCIGPNHREQAMWIKEKYESFGFVNVEVDSFQLNIIDSVTWHYNIIATIVGSENPDQIIVLGGHWDSVNWDDTNAASPGADDNASGTVAAMEVARVMKQSGYQPELTIKFVAFDAEEVGLLGSNHFAENAVMSGMDIKLMINNDMIANSGNDWFLRVFPYDNSDWAYNLAYDFVASYTTISPLPGAMNSAGSDSYSFWSYGFPAVYFFEYEFSPNYHSPTDLVDNCNMEYYTEAIKASCALTTSITLVPYHVENLVILQVGNGTSLLLSWDPVFNNDVLGYNIYTFDEYDVFDNQYFTEETNYELSGLIEGQKYKIAVGAIDEEGNEGKLIFVEKTPYSVSLDQGIAIIDESFGGILDPSDEDIDNFYEILLSNYEHTKFDILDKDEMSLAELGKFSTIIWHHNKLKYTTSIFDSQEMLKDYLTLGGNLLLTSDRISFAINEEGLYNEYNVFNDGDFIKDYLKIDSSYIKTISLFKGAKANNENLPDLNVDTTKTSADNNYHLMLTVESIFPGEEGDAIYLYDTEYEQNANQGIMKNMPVGVLNSNETFNTLTLGFPLYYMNLYQSKTFIDQVLQNVFGESTNSINEVVNQNNDILIWPIPASDFINISFKKFETTIKQLSIFDIYGNLVQQESSPENNRYISIQDLETGMYFLSIETSNNHFSKRIIKH